MIHIQYTDNYRYKEDYREIVYLKIYTRKAN